MPLDKIRIVLSTGEVYLEIFAFSGELISRDNNSKDVANVFVFLTTAIFST